MWLWTRQEAKQIDELTIRSGIPAEKLMETAGLKSSSLILKLAPLAQTAVVFCGPGNNGGDGFVIARDLRMQGLNVTVVEFNSERNSSLREQKKSEYSGSVISLEQLHQAPFPSDIWVDAFFGIGLTRDLDVSIQKTFQIVKEAKGLKVAIDTPSGLDVDTGEILGSCFEADYTLTVGRPKPGFYLNQGPQVCGKILSLEIGFKKEISASEARSVFLASSNLISRWIPKRSPTDNKTRGGRTLIWAGRREMPGAALLAARAALRVGSGYVYSSQSDVVRFSPEIIPWDKNISQMQSVLLGPGLGTGPKTIKAIRSLQEAFLPVVIDADALTVAARESQIPFPKHWIATPHAGELARFLNVPAKEIEKNRIRFAQIAQKKLGCVVVLKGFHTVIAYPGFSVIIPTGNVALAKGGSGDVLGGMMAGFLSQNLSFERAPILAAFLHGKIADDWVRGKRDPLSLTPTDLLIEIPKTLRKLRK